MRNAKSCNVVHRLHSLQLGEKHRNLFTRIPARLQFPVETVVDNQNRLLGCILLGFTAEGHHLLSYTSTHGYRVQIWRFLWGQQAELLAEIDLFGGQRAFDKPISCWSSCKT
ncbi:TPA: DDB1 and CUL4 associated factor 15 [Trebouxia sp. C0006]